MTTTLAPLPVFRSWDNNGNPLAGGQLFTYAAGTTTPLATYTDSTGSIQNTNPVVLNSRGEANVWLTPNVAYKLALQDPLGNPIWTIDQIVNAQLITLYGGVDTGVANAYVLNFAANFTSYTDGIVVYWIPSNANTGASTININGLGVINLVNQNGSALTAGQITPNQVASLMIKGGQALLINNTVASSVLAVAGSAFSPSIAFQGDPSSGFYWTAAGLLSVAIGGNPAGAITSGSATGTLTGVSGTVNVTCRYAFTGDVIVLRVPQISGTSNSTSFGMTVSSSVIRPSTTASQWVSCSAMQDNGAAIYSQVGVVSQGGAGITSFSFYKNGNVTGWTNSGTKGIGDGGAGQVNNIFVYQWL